MNETIFFNTIKDIILDVLPGLKKSSFTINDSLRELGANSIDRAEILIRALASLQIKIPLVELAKAQNIRELYLILSTMN